LAIVVSPSGILVDDAALDEASVSAYAGAFVARFSDPDRSESLAPTMTRGGSYGPPPTGVGGPCDRAGMATIQRKTALAAAGATLNERPRQG
jgi:hypothetical protein